MIFHSAVLAYVGAELRAAFVDEARQAVNERGAVRISNEGAAVLAPILLDPTAAARLRQSAEGRILLTVNGSLVAWAGPHGQSLDRL